MKKFLGAFIALTLAFGNTLAYADDLSGNVKVKIDGTEINFDTAPIIENDRVLVPMRAIFEALGCGVMYNESEEGKHVFAIKGENGILFEIDADTMIFNGEEITLDAPAKIYNDRTLVPLRAISESFEADVIWSGESRTVDITTKQGEHKITPVTKNMEIKNDAGVKLSDIVYSYPVIENNENSSFIDELNSMYKENAEKFVEEAVKVSDDAKLLLDEMGESKYPEMTFLLTYEVNYDKNNILSITNNYYEYTGGAHGIRMMVSENYNVADGSKLALTDVLIGEMDELEIGIYDSFVKLFEETAGDNFVAEWAAQIENEAGNVKFYIKDGGIVLYFDVYQVAPYAYGIPKVEFKYNENAFKLDLSK